MDRDMDIMKVLNLPWDMDVWLARVTRDGSGPAYEPLRVSADWLVRLVAGLGLDGDGHVMARGALVRNECCCRRKALGYLDPFACVSLAYGAKDRNAGEGFRAWYEMVVRTVGLPMLDAFKKALMSPGYAPGSPVHGQLPFLDRFGYASGWFDGFSGLDAALRADMET
jgi:hypothetical protein